MTAVVPSGEASQTTNYAYGVSPATGSAISDNDLLRQTSYPNPTTATGWTFSASAGVTGNGTAFTYGNPSAPQGSQAGFLQGDGSVSQSVALAAGTYTLSFAAGHWAGCWS